MNSALLQKNTGRQNLLTFAILWALTFAIYLPTVKAGWTIDAVGGIYNLKHLSFSDFINGRQSSIQSLYQEYMLDLFVFYKLWGVNPWMWSLLFITTHAANAFLAWRLCRTLFEDTSIKNASVIALCGAVLFTVCPYISEVLVWKACFHYLQGFLFLLLALRWVQRYQHEQKNSYALGAVAIYLLSCFSLEVFYLTPFFILTLALYYRCGLNRDHAIFRKTILYFFVPHILMLGGYFLLMYTRFGHLTPHVNNVFTQTAREYLSNPPKYLFHILAFGRFFSTDAKDNVSAFCGDIPFLVILYSLIILVLVDKVTRFRQFTPTGKAAFLLSVWWLLTIAFLVPLPFPGTKLLVFYDRYLYFTAGFFYIFLCLLIGRVLNKYIALGLFVAYGCIALFFTVKANTYWKRSAYITNRLIKNLPDAGNKTILLLNLPENMNGVPMIGAQPEGQFRMMSEILGGKQISNPIYDVVSYNMLDAKSGAHITVSNDSILHITLNQWKTWWWYGGHGATTYENEAYKMNMIDPGHWYELILKRPRSEYLILYQSEDQWKEVDWKKREDQY